MVAQTLAEQEEPMARADIKFHWGCQNGNMGAVEYWLEQGADINLMAKGSTPLLRCAGGFQDKPDILRYILERGAKTDIMTPCNEQPRHTALHLAALLGHSGIVKVLIDHGADVNAVNEDGYTPLKMNELFTANFEITVERRQNEIREGKAAIKEYLTAAGGVLDIAELQNEVNVLAAEEPAITSAETVQALATPTTPNEQVKSPAQSLTPIQRVGMLEAAMNKEGKGGVISRLGDVETELLGEPQKGTIPERLAQLEDAMGLC